MRDRKGQNFVHKNERSKLRKDIDCLTIKLYGLKLKLYCFQTENIVFLCIRNNSENIRTIYFQPAKQ